MVYTIEVKKKEKDEKFKFGDLEMEHKECFGGKIKPLNLDHWLHVDCTRCEVKRKINLTEETQVAIMRLAIDRGELKFEEDIVMIQKREI